MATHLAALDRLGRTRLVAVASARDESARATAGPYQAAAYTDVDRMLDEQRPDVVYVAVPPSAAVAIVGKVVERGIPFLTEKPLAAIDADGPARIAAAVAERGLIAAVGYHLRALDGLDEVTALLAANPVRLVIARWLSSTPAPAWWRRVDDGGGQVVEQATHFYDLARRLVGEASVIGAASTRSRTRSCPRAPTWSTPRPRCSGSKPARSGASPTRAASQPTWSRSSSRQRISSSRSGVSAMRPAASRSRSTTARLPRTLPPERDPYESQAARFLDAVEARDPARVFSTYADALLTDRLTRAVVAATGRPG